MSCRKSASNGIQRAAALTPRELVARDHPKVFVHDWHEPIECFAPAASRLGRQILIVLEGIHGLRPTRVS